MADWSNLPKDILIVAFQCLEIPGLLRSSSVCRSWRCAADELRRLRLPSPFQTPWLLTCAKRQGDQLTAELYSLSEAKTYTVSLPHPPIRRRICIGSSHGWLITADNKSELHLLNPITGAQIDLPRVSTFHHIKTTFRPNGEIKRYKVYEVRSDSRESYVSFNPEELRYYLYERASLSSSPSEGSNYIVMVIHGLDNMLSFARAGDKKWTTLPRRRNLEGYYSGYRNCIYYKGVLLAVTSIGIVQEWDIINGVIPEQKEKDAITEPKEIPDSRTEDYKYFVQTPWGDLLQVWRERDIEEKINEDGREVTICKTVSAKVYKMDFDSRRYIEVSSLGGYVLFLGCSDPLFLSSKDFPMLRSNCIYFTDDWSIITFCQNSRYDISIYNMEDGTSEQILPNDPRLTWPPPVWVTPTLISSTLVSI